METGKNDHRLRLVHTEGVSRLCFNLRMVTESHTISRCTDIRSHRHSFPRGFWQGRTFVLTSNDHPGHSCSHQITTPDIRAHIKLSVAEVGPGVHPEGQCYVRDGDLQGPQGAVEGETWATWNQSTPEGNEEALPGGSGWQQECCPVPGWGWTLHQDPYMNSVSVSV